MARTSRADALRLLATPRWVALTLLLLLASALFARASDWQYDRAIASVQAQRAQAAIAVPVAELVPDSGTVPDSSLGRPVFVTGRYAVGAWVPGRSSADGVPGYWLVSGVDDGSGVVTAVLRGWRPEKSLGPGAAVEATVTGRVHSDENFYVDVPAGSPDEVVALTAGNLAASWSQPVRPGYLVLAEQDPALTPDDPSPVPPVFGAGGSTGFPWQNAGYALQWVVFIGFAGFMYLRWFRDDLQRHREARAAPTPDRSPAASDVP